MKITIYTQKVGVVLSGTMSHVDINDMQKTSCLKGRGEDVMMEKYI